MSEEDRSNPWMCWVRKRLGRELVVQIIRAVVALGLLGLVVGVVTLQAVRYSLPILLPAAALALVIMLLYLVISVGWLKGGIDQILLRSAVLLTLLQPAELPVAYPAGSLERKWGFIEQEGDGSLTRIMIRAAMGWRGRRN